MTPPHPHQTPAPAGRDAARDADRNTGRGSGTGLAQEPSGRPAQPVPADRGDVGPPDGRTRYANGQRRRAEIVDAAMTVFAERGFQHLSLRQVAEAVGVSHSMLRHHFGTKDRLLEAVLARREEAESAWRQQLLTHHSLLDALPAIMEHNATIPGLIQLDTVLRAEALNPDHPAHDYVTGLGRRFHAAVLEDLRREQEAGLLREALDLELLTHELTALIEGIQTEWLYDRGVDIAAVVRSFARRLYRDQAEE